MSPLIFFHPTAKNINRQLLIEKLKNREYKQAFITLGLSQFIKKFLKKLNILFATKYVIDN